MGLDVSSLVLILRTRSDQRFVNHRNDQVVSRFARSSEVIDLHSTPLDARANASVKNNHIPALDGMRALAVSMVLICHFWPRASSSKWVVSTVERMGFGVEVFFVISGFLITHLLLNEEKKFSDVSLGLFYIRRFLRILPPLFAYLITLYLLTQVGFAETPTLDLFYCAMFVRNFFGSSLETAHCWSLSVEEHFYLAWPFIFVALKNNYLRLAFCLVVIALTPIWSTIVLRSLADGESLNSWRTDLRLTGIAMGSSLACFRFTPVGRRILSSEIVANPWTFFGFVLVIGLALFSDILNQPGLRALVPMITALCVGGVINAGLEGPESGWVRVLEWSPIATFGKMSYTVYLWQQLFTHRADDPSGTFLRSFIQLVCALLVAGFAYIAIEKPLQRYRERWRRKRAFVDLKQSL